MGGTTISISSLILQECSIRDFCVIGNFVSITSKTLREDRTAADKKHVAYCDPPQAENLAGEILFMPGIQK